MFVAKKKIFFLLPGNNKFSAKQNEFCCHEKKMLQNKQNGPDFFFADKKTRCSVDVDSKTFAAKQNKLPSGFFVVESHFCFFAANFCFITEKI